VSVVVSMSNSVRLSKEPECQVHELEDKSEHERDYEHELGRERERERKRARGLALEPPS
jgi:hypothetical protein